MPGVQADSSLAFGMTNPSRYSRFLTLRQAINTLESCGLKIGKIFYIPTFDADAVQQQRYNGKIILAGTRLDKGSVVELTVGIGAKGQTEIKDTATRQDSIQ